MNNLPKSRKTNLSNSKCVQMIIFSYQNICSPGTHLLKLRYGSFCFRHTILSSGECTLLILQVVIRLGPARNWSAQSGSKKQGATKNSELTQHTNRFEPVTKFLERSVSAHSLVLSIPYKNWDLLQEGSSKKFTYVQIDSILITVCISCEG